MPAKIEIVFGDQPSDAPLSTEDMREVTDLLQAAIDAHLPTVTWLAEHRASLLTIRQHGEEFDGDVTFYYPASPFIRPLRAV